MKMQLAKYRMWEILLIQMFLNKLIAVKSF